MAFLQFRDVDLNVARQNKLDKKKTWQFFRELGLVDGNFLHARNYDGVQNVWAGQPAYVIGAGPSLRATLTAVGGWDFFRGKHTITINHVVEDFDDSEWHLFLDKRFLDITPYDIKKYRGTIFAKCTTGLKPAERVKIFYTQMDHVGSKMEDGLYGSLSGVAAVNLALISGANPIYLCGLDAGAAKKTTGHYKDGYTGEVQRRGDEERFVRIMRQFDRYKPEAHRLRLVTDGGDQIPWARRVDPRTLVRADVLRVEPRKARVVHISFSDNPAVHADITRFNVSHGVGARSMYSTRSGAPLPPADVYVAEHFLSTNDYLAKLPDEVKRKTINIVHTVGCIPAGPWRRVIALTQAWGRWLAAHQVKVDRVIVPGIDLAPYNDVTPDYAAQKFGRITRWNAEKIPPRWNDTVKAILDAVPAASCTMWVNKEKPEERPLLQHPRMSYRRDCTIDMFKGKFLKELSVYVHANGSFQETLSFAVIEAMATGLPIVYLSEGTGVIEEVVAGCGVRCETLDQVRDTVIAMLQDEAYRREYGALARDNTRRFDVLRMVREFDEEVTACLR